MRYFPASDLGHQSLEEMFSLPESHDPTKDLYTYLKGYLQTLQATDGAEQKSQLPIQAEIYRQLVPRAKYPKNWSQKDIDRFDDYWETDIKVLSVTPKHTGASWVNLAKPVTPGDDQGKNFNPTLLSFSQKIYDAEMTRRESINTRCGALLSTAGHPRYACRGCWPARPHSAEQLTQTPCLDCLCSFCRLSCIRATFDHYRTAGSGRHSRRSYRCR